MTFERGNWLVDLTEDYSQLFSECNWYTYRFINVEFENEAMLGGYELSIALLGFGLRVRWNHTETDTMREIRDRVAEITGDRPSPAPKDGGADV